MQFLSILALVASASVAFAQSNSGQVCKSDQKQACCKTDNSGVLGGLLGGSCELNVLGQNCAGQTACCKVDGSGAILGGSCQPAVNL